MKWQQDSMDLDERRERQPLVNTTGGRYCTDCKLDIVSETRLAYHKQNCHISHARNGYCCKCEFTCGIDRSVRAFPSLSMGSHDQLWGMIATSRLPSHSLWQLHHPSRQRIVARHGRIAGARCKNGDDKILTIARRASQSMAGNKDGYAPQTRPASEV